MKRLFTSVRTLLLALCFLLPAFALAERPLVVVGEEWPPFEFKQGDQVVGIDVDIAKAIFDRMGITADFQLHVWKRAWSFVEEGNADAVFSTSRKEAREPFLYYPEENMWVSSFVFFVKKDLKKDNFKGYEDAAGLKVGVVRGNSYNEAFWEAKLNTVEAGNLETNLKKLAGGRIDLVPADKTVGLYTAKLLGIQDQIDFYAYELFSKGYPMPFAKNSKYPNIEELSKRFEAELKTLKADGTYDKIMEKWLGKR